MHTQSGRGNLDPLIESQDVNEMKSLSLMGAQWGRGSDTRVCIGEDAFAFEYLACFLDLRASWTTGFRTRTTSCLFPPFMEDRGAVRLRPARLWTPQTCRPAVIDEEMTVKYKIMCFLKSFKEL